MPAAFITSPTLAPARPRSRSRRDALATIRPWLFSFSSCDIRIGSSENFRLTTWKMVTICLDVNHHPNRTDVRRANMTQPTILVTGSTGNTGGAVVSELLHRGVPVRAMVRSRDARSAALQARGAEVVVADI